MAKPRLGTKNDDVFFVIDEDEIDGKLGFDWAVFEGSIDDYEIVAKGAGNLKIDVLGESDKTSLKHVEMLVFDNGTADFRDDSFYDVQLGTVLQVDTSLDPSAQETPGFTFPGSGNIASDYTVVRNDGAGVELGLQVKYRQGPTRDPVSVEADGTVHFTVNTGPQSTANGSSVNHANRAAWSFDYSIATGLNGETTDLSDFTFKLLIDTDITLDTSFRELTLEVGTTSPPAGFSGFIWRDQDELIRIADDGGNANVTQNSENYAFGFIRDFIDGDPGTPGVQPYNFTDATFDIQLQAYDGDTLIAANKIVVEVGDGLWLA